MCICAYIHAHISCHMIVWPNLAIYDICMCIKSNPYLKGAPFRKCLGCMYLYPFHAADTSALGTVEVAVFFGRRLCAVPLGPGGGAGAERGEVKAQSAHGREAGRRRGHVTPGLAYRCLNLWGGKNNRTNKQTNKKHQQTRPVWMRLNEKFWERALFLSVPAEAQ